MQTLTYYNKNAKAFIEGTINVDFQSTQDRFLKQLPPNASILDFGCGSGRDARYFLSKGYRVSATDGSEELCRLASDYTGIKVKQMLFQELDETDHYDGIWACSSILHLSWEELVQVLGRMARALHGGGIVYTSFKYGEFEGERNGRYFTDMTEERLERLVAESGVFRIEEQWATSDVRPDRREEQWLNILLRKN